MSANGCHRRDARRVAMAAKLHRRRRAANCGMPRVRGRGLDGRTVVPGPGQTRLRAVNDIVPHMPDYGQACSVVLAQLAPVAGAIEPNVATVVELAAAHRGADLIVLPELFLGGYLLDLADELAIEPDGPEFGRMREATSENDLGARARALENGTPNVYVNLVGEYGGLSFRGESQLVGPDGRPELHLGHG